MFKIGDYLIKANKGVCVVTDIMHPDFVNTPADKLYYMLKSIDDSGGIFFVPVDCQDGTLRRVVTDAEAWEVINSISGIEAVWIDNDKKREQVYKDAIKSNDPVELVRIIKNMFNRRLERLGQGKKNTAVDERYFKLAESTLLSELAFATGRTKEQIKETIMEIVGEKKNGET